MSAPAAESQTYSIDVVTEALLREHLTKKTYADTLEAFKSEQPQLPHSITKRSILQQLLGLEAAATELQSRPGSSSTSTLELWVQQQLLQKAGTTSSSDAAAQQLGKPLEMTIASSNCSSSVPATTNGAEVQPRHMQADRPTSQGAIAQTTSVATAAVAAGKLPTPRVPGSRCVVPAAVSSSSSSSSVRHAMSGGAACSSQPGTAAQQIAVSPGSWQGNVPALPEAALAHGLQQHQHPGLQEQQMQQHMPSKPLPPAAAFAPATAAPAPDPVFKDIEEQQLQGARLAGMGPLRASAVAATSNVAATVGPAALSSRIRPSAALEQQLQKELVLEDIADEDDVHSAPVVPGATFNSSSSSPAPSRLFGSSSSSVSISSGFAGSSGSSSSLDWLQPLLPEQQRQLSKLLWGAEVARPDASWQQGLVFAETPGLDWGLVQLAGGPCGVLAAVQAHLIATLMEQGLWGLVLRPEQLQEALAASLATLLWAARSSSSAKVVMLLLATGSAAARGMCDAAQAVRMAQVASADSRQQLEALVKAALPQWCQRKGWGLLLLLYSLLLTRGCSVVAGDMDEAGTPLVDGLGYCSMELVNLMLTGTACSNVFDGRRQFACEDGADSNGTHQGAASAADSHVLKGVTSQARVGLLTLFEWYRYVEVGQNLKSPRFPVWVVCSESHFSTLAHAASQQQHSGTGAAKSQTYAGLSSSLQPAPGAAVVLEYYDGMARQEEPIQLQLLPAPGGVGWSSRMAGVAEDRGCWQGRPIPPLECVVETKWRDVAVTWHGSEPIL